ncbi:uromodulin-like [Colossoma macropomum]|uniref:uromodulin-like n=1 Tax=Colossoma macropomum TaxID=42526 RepID=UPI001864A8C2|nr:uromodulin-like [Colossoma macropomum]
MRSLIPLCVLLLVNAADSADPCNSYNTLDNYWRNIRKNYTGHDDTLAKWRGWYRLFLNGKSAQMSEWCVSNITCGGVTPLLLSESHPQVADGIVTREVIGSQISTCSSYKSKKIKVKACPGNYYVYKLVKPAVSIPGPSYCAVFFRNSIVDPCQKYTALHDPWRSTTSITSTNCDKHINWVGWYRLFSQGQSTKMPETCVSPNRCGTNIPLWLSGSHPNLQDGVVVRQICGSYGSDCCFYKSLPIQVKACPGNYYVYKFVKPKFCNAAYCTDDSTETTTDVPTSTTSTTISTDVPTTDYVDHCKGLTCTVNEKCGKRNKIYGCLCNENQNRSNPDIYDARKTCESSSGTVSLSRCQLFEDGFSAGKLHLNDPSCRGTIKNGRVEFFFDSDDHICGTNLRANGTHLIYENFIQVDSTAGTILREKRLNLSFSCVYSLTKNVSMNIKAIMSIIHKQLPPGQGMYRVKMIPYQDSGFSQPLQGKVIVKVNQPLYVSVEAEGVDSRQIALLLDSCWATPVNDPDYYLHWDLIIRGCPNPKDGTVQIVQNGISTSSRFAFRMFNFKDASEVFFHCNIHLCLLQSNNCTAQCKSGFHRRTRSVDFHDSASISVGPINSIRDTVSPSLFYPFGSGAGDAVNPSIDDGSSSAVNLQSPFSFFGRLYSQIYVNNNGHLTFDQPLVSFTPVQFNIYRRDIIAPFWTDIDNRGTGIISYNQYTSGSVLSQATRDINQYFPGVNFTASWVFVATWDKVAYLSSPGTAGYGTISSDGFEILWSNSTVQANVPNLINTSNVGVPGCWAFRVNQGSASTAEGIFKQTVIEAKPPSTSQEIKCGCRRGASEAWRGAIPGFLAGGTVTGSETSMDSISQNPLGDHVTPDPPTRSNHRSASPEY